MRNLLSLSESRGDFPMASYTVAEEHDGCITAPRVGCGKRPYRSVKHARAACRRMGNRIRVHWCEDCGAYHVTHNEKMKREGDRW